MGRDLAVLLLGSGFLCAHAWTSCDVFWRKEFEELDDLVNSSCPKEAPKDPNLGCTKVCEDAYYALMKKFRECMNTEIRGKVFAEYCNPMDAKEKSCIAYAGDQGRKYQCIQRCCPGVKQTCSDTLGVCKVDTSSMASTPCKMETLLKCNGWSKSSAAAFAPSLTRALVPSVLLALALKHQGWC